MLESRDENGDNQRELDGHSADHSLGPDDRENSATTPAYPIMTRHSVDLDRLRAELANLGVPL